jgi:hypothetical protein
VPDSSQPRAVSRISRSVLFGGMDSAVHQDFSLGGKLSKRCPVALESALATAGAITGVAGSPTPVSGCAELTICTFTRGI